MAVSLYLYLDLLYTDYLESHLIEMIELKEYISWAISMLLILAIAIKTIYSFSNDIKNSIVILKRLCPSKPNEDELVAIKPGLNQQF